MKGGLGNILKNAHKIQEQMQNTQEAIQKIEVIGESGVGMVKVTMNGQHDIIAVDIDNSVFKEDKALLEDLLGAAVNDANKKLERAIKEKVSAITGGIDLPAGIKLPF